MADLPQRASRSRYSSPFATPQNATRGVNEPAERPKTFLDKWIEPQLAPARPSFAEAGIERHGVVANMAPLGTRPSAKVLKASTRPEPLETITRSSTRKAGQSAVSTPSETISTPEPQINIVRRRSLSAKADSAEQAPQTPVQQQPQTPQTPQGSARKSIPRPSTSTAGQQQGQGVFALQHSPLPLSATRHSMSFAPPPSQFGPNGEYRVDLEMTDRVVESAVQEALDNRRWPTAYALRTLYDDHRLNPRMVRLIDTIYNGRADDNQLQEFKNVMKHKKKEGKKDRTGEYYFNGDGSDPLPGPSQFTPTHTRTPSFSGGPLGGPATGALSSVNASSATASISASASASPQKEGEHVSKKHKTNRFPSLSMERNEDAAGHVKSPKKHHHHHRHHHQNGSGRTQGRNRSASNTSSSSLSSVDEHIINSSYRTSPAGGPRAHPPSRSAHAETHPGARFATRPISATKESGPKTYTFPTVTAASASSSSINNAPTSPTSTIAPASDVMAPAALLALAPPTQGSQGKGKKDPTKVTSSRWDEDDPAVRMKRRAREVTDRSIPVLESFERHQLQHRRPRRRGRGRGSESVSPERENSAPPSAATGKRQTLRLLHNSGKRTRQSSHTANYESDSHSSPTLLSFQPDLAPGSLSESRAGTPSAQGRPGRKPKTGTGGLRVKTSPMKKKGGGPLAGLPRQSGERSPTGNGATNNLDDNDDYCCACGGSGELMCCDGCTRSLHFLCVDPPMREGDSVPEGEWFCKPCAAARNPRAGSERGLFGNLNYNLEKKNPSSFHLPKDVREYFVNVKTGPEGEYDEGAAPKPKNRAGYEEAPDYFRLKDTKGKAILCHQCHRSASAPDRAVIPCTYCGLYWHLDCLEVPLAKEPGPRQNFRCPAHIDDLLVTLPHSLAPAHRFRKIKGASAIRPAVSRGIQNNGHIEIENDPTDDERELGFYEQREYGHVYKLPEMGIKLDFISQVRRKTGGRGGCAPIPAAHHPTQIPAPKQALWEQRSLLEQQAVLNLAALAIPSPKIGNSQMLVDALLSEASPAVLALIAQGDATNLAENNLNSSKDRNTLVALRALIDSKLAAFNEKPATPELAINVDVDGDKALEEAEVVVYPSDEELDGHNFDADEGEDNGKGEESKAGSGEGAAGADKDGDTEMSDEVDG